MAYDYFAQLAAQQASGEAFPSIVSTPPPEVSTGTKSLQRLKVALNKTAQVQVSGNFVCVENISLTVNGTSDAGQIYPLIVKPDTGPAVVVDTPYKSIYFPTAFTQLLLSYAGPAGYSLNCVVTLSAGFGVYSLDDAAQARNVFAVNATLTRPANVTPYAASQIVGNPVVAGIGMNFQKVFRAGSPYSRITKARIYKNSATTANANFRLHLFANTSGVSMNVDQTAFQVDWAEVDKEIGVINFPSFITGGAGSDAAFCVLDGLDLLLYNTPLSADLATGGYTSVFGWLEALAAYVPTSGELIRVDLWGEQY